MSNIEQTREPCAEYHSLEIVEALNRALDKREEQKTNSGTGRFDASRSNTQVTASHLTLRHHNAACVKVRVRSRRLVLVPGVEGRNIQVSTRIVIGRS